MNVLIIDGACYEINPEEPRRSGRVYLQRDTIKAYEQIDDMPKTKSYPLTLLPDDDKRVVQWRLGGNAIKSVKPEERDSITGDLRHPKQGEDFAGGIGERRTASQDYEQVQAIILRPPAPKPKTSDDYLAEILAIREKMLTVGDITELNDVCRAAAKHLADTADIE